jgi:predicted dehydrogenase
VTVRWGFLGAGWIAATAMARAVHEARGAVLWSAAARDPDRAARLEPHRVVPSYADLLADDEVDAVYISLDNAAHERWTLAALSAGKHVLCEKPLGIDLAQVDRMVAAAGGRLLVEAAWCRWHPRWRRLEHLARSGALGDITSVDSAFTFTSDVTDTFRGDLAGGGALLDVGVYQGHAWAAVLGIGDEADVLEVRRDTAPSGVDLTTRVRAQCGRTRMSAVASFAMPEHQFLTVTGRDAVVRLDRGQPFTSWRVRTKLRIDDRTEDFAPVDAYRLMVEAVSARASGDEEWVVPLAETRWVARALDTIGGESRA